LKGIIHGQCGRPIGECMCSNASAIKIDCLECKGQGVIGIKMYFKGKTSYQKIECTDCDGEGKIIVDI